MTVAGTMSVPAVHRFAPASTVRHAVVDGLRVVLDLGTERYRVLDDVASVLWSVLIGETNASLAYDDLACRYDIDRDRFGSDLAAFAQRCVAERLLQTAGAHAVGAPAVAASRGDRAGTLQALTSLVATRRALARDGFRATYERYALLPAGSRTRLLADVLPAFARAENFFIARRAPKDCLLRSLSLFRFLRSAGVAADHVIGARRFPFVAHAWVECDGSPVRDDRAKDFTPLARIHAAQPRLET